MLTADQIIADMKQRANAQAVEGMARFGIRPAQALGISIPTLRKMAKAIGRNQVLAVALWASGTARWVARDALKELQAKEIKN